MIKKIKLFLIIGIILLLAGCTVVEGEAKDRIISPDNINIPITGKWEATYIYDDGFIPIEDEKALEERGIEAYNFAAFFHSNGVAVGEKFTENPSFRIKNVLAYDYFTRNFRVTPEDLNIDKERIEVITVLNTVLNEKILLFDLIRLNQDTILIRSDDILYIFQKVIDNVSQEEVNRYIQVQKDVMKTKGEPENEDVQTGLLLGLKIPQYDEFSNNIDWDYKSIWINTEDGEVTGAYEADTLLLPRKNGFWEIKKRRSFTKDIVRDNIVATPLFRLTGSASRNLLSREDFTDLLDKDNNKSELKNILFVGNDYISVENIDIDNNNKRTLEIYSIDQLQAEKPIKLSDIIGEDGKILFTEGARAEMSLDNNIAINEENIGLFRRNGHWSLTGRVNYFQNGEELFKDFNIRAIPPQEMVSFDEQIIPISMVKLVVPGLKDYFSSPNGEFIVALTNHYLTVYPINNGELIRTPITRIRIPNDSTVIISEWARGRYTQTWENEIIDNGGVQIEE